MMTRTYSELSRLPTFEERFDYLSLDGVVSECTFGSKRGLNQSFYTGRRWRELRHYVISRDEGCDLGIFGYEIFHRPIVHHLNPITVDALLHGDPWIEDPENLITTTHNTHNAIHYGDSRLLSRPSFERRPGDTKLW